MTRIFADVVRASRSATIAAVMPEPTMHTSLSMRDAHHRSLTLSIGSGLRAEVASGRQVSVPIFA